MNYKEYEQGWGECIKDFIEHGDEYVFEKCRTHSIIDDDSMDDGYRDCYLEIVDNTDKNGKVCWEEVKCCKRIL